MWFPESEDRDKVEEIRFEGIMLKTLQIWLRTLILIVKEFNKPSMVHVKRYTKITHNETLES